MKSMKDKLRDRVRRIVGKPPKRPKTPDAKLLAVLTDHGIDHVFDVGANTGQTHDKLRAHGFRGKITSFEPLPSAHAVLSEKAKSDPGWIIADRVAIGAEPGEADINVSEASDMSSLLDLTEETLIALKKSVVVETVPTRVAPLDSLFDQYARTDERVFLKIDTQGYEKHVLDGAPKTLARIAGIQVELSLLPMYQGESHYLDLLRRLEGLGFETYMLTETNFSANLCRQLQIDAVMFRKDAA